MNGKIFVEGKVKRKEGRKKEKEGRLTALKPSNHISIILDLSVVFEILVYVGMRSGKGTGGMDCMSCSSSGRLGVAAVYGTVCSSDSRWRGRGAGVGDDL